MVVVVGLTPISSTFAPVLQAKVQSSQFCTSEIRSTEFPAHIRASTGEILTEGVGFTVMRILA